MGNITGATRSEPSGVVLAMRVHVIYAHPLADSFAASWRSGHQVDDCDLCGERFDPVQSPDLAALLTA